jgi:predicted nucleic acid-binding protein
MNYVVDCSFCCALFLPDERSSVVDAFFKSITEKDTILVPSLWWYEIANVLAIAARRERLTHAQMNEIISLMETIDMTTKEVRSLMQVKTLYEIAQLYTLTAYDAAYLALVIAESACLVTLDESLLNAGKKAGVDVYEHDA